MSSENRTGTAGWQSNGGTISRFDERQRQEEKQLRKAEREYLRLAFDTAHEELSQQNKTEVHEIIVDAILPNIPLASGSVYSFERRVQERPEEFHPELVRKFLRNQSRIRSVEVYQDLLTSLETVASIDGPLPSVLQRYQPVYEYEHQIGTRLLSEGQNIDPHIQAIDPDGEWKATLFAGSTGSGKSTSLGTVIEDRFAAGHKIVDLVEMNKAENATYDIPAQHELADIREEEGFDVGFEELGQPNIEILVPMTRDLDEGRIPIDEDGNTVVRPFTVPASELTFRQLIMQLPHTTEVWEHAIQTAYQKLDMRDEDWTLEDLATEVRMDPKTQPRVADRVESALESVQNKGFIRDKQSPYTLDWDEIMRDEETITSFTLFQVRGKLDKMLLASYLVDSVAEARDALKRKGTIKQYPTLSVVIREMHTVAPRNKSEHDGQRSVEGLTIENLQEFFSLMRHANAEILGDTQQFHRQLDPGVSEHFDRIYCFGGHKKDIQKVLNTRENPSGKPEEKIARYKEGKCCLVSGRLGYKMPIQFLPPRFHHLDSQRDGDGFSFRGSVDCLDEELRPVPWDVSVPDRLRFHGQPSSNPVEKFCDIAIEQTNDRNDHAFKDEITVAYNKWAEKNDEIQYDHRKLHGEIKSRLGLDDETDAQIMRNGKRKGAHRTIRLQDSFRVSTEEIQREFSS